MESTITTVLDISSTDSFISSDSLWVVILAFFIGFCLAFSVGANDVANSFGTSVGSKVLTLRQALILATIFEVLGAVLMGYKVSDTIRKGIFDIEMYSGFEKELMLGYLSALSGSAIWNLVATFFRWPISGTHSIVGAVVGFSLVGRGFYSIKWTRLGQIVASWFLSPVLSGLLSAAVFLFVKKFILQQRNSMERGYLALPYFYAFTVFINVFSIVHKGPSYLCFNIIPWWGVLILSSGFGFIVGMCIWYFFIPFLKKKENSIYGAENTKSETTHDGDKTLSDTIKSSDIENIENPMINELKSTRKISTEESDFHDSIQKNPMNLELKNTEEIDLNESDLHNSTGKKKNKHSVLTIKSSKSQESVVETSKMFSSLQVLTAVFGSFAHGANDVSNAIGPVVAIWLIFKDGNVMQNNESPFWIMLFGGFGISVGLWVWGQKVIRTIGEDLTKITPASGFTIEIGAASTVLIASKIGLPISTTHCKVGSVVFVGWAHSKAGVDWKLFRSIILAWVLTLPISGGLSAMMMAILKTATIT